MSKTMKIGLANAFLIFFTTFFLEIHAEDDLFPVMSAQDREELILRTLVEENLRRRCVEASYIDKGRTEFADIGMCAFGNPKIVPDKSKKRDGYNTTLTYEGICGVFGNKLYDTEFETSELGSCHCLNDADVASQ